MAKAHGDKDTSVFPDALTDVGEKNAKTAEQKKAEQKGEQKKEPRKADPAATLKSLQEIVLDDDEGEATPEKPEDRIAELLDNLDAASASSLRVPLKEWTRQQEARFKTRSTIANQGVVAAMARAGAIY